MYSDDARAPIVLQPPLNSDEWRREDPSFVVEGASARHRFKEFFRNFRLNSIYPYRDSLIRHWNNGEYFVEVNVEHLNEYDEALYNSLKSNPNEILPMFEAASKDALQASVTEQSADNPSDNRFRPIREFQIVLKSEERTLSLRAMTADHVNQLIRVSGIVISCSKVKSKTTLVAIKCTKCATVKKIPCKSAMGSVTLPLSCDRDGQDGEDCGRDSFVIMTDNCEFIDQQTLKLQEAPEVVPTGEMPRSTMLTVDRYLTDQVAPGTRVSVLGVCSLMNMGSKVGSSSSIRTPYLRVVGIDISSAGSGRVSTALTSAEEEQMQRLARDPHIYEKIANSIAPQISGDYTKDIKKAIACLLIGGSRKTLGDGIKLRGDINVLLMGDPSTAKSQFLKFVERAAPIGVYTSGKGSSAAGLTASVIRDAKGEFYLEGGAMVLADGGVICIDEFDKMREQDRVAIHEAMEQQTISIAKAGITTMLNSRTSVLAAANPVFGRYDDLKSVGENIDLMSTILSRFDCIFIVRDVRDEERDRSIARHVLGVHVNAGMATTATPDIDVSTLRKFIAYCRDRCAPRLSDEAAAFLSAQYVQIRDRVRVSLQDKPGAAQVVPITTRQLEALVRLSESLAKMRLSAEATIADVEEALRLFKVSTLAASQANPALFGVAGSSDDVKRAEEFLRRRLGVRVTTNSKMLVEEAMVQGFPEDAIRRAIAVMITRGDVQELNQRKILKRIR